MSDSDIESQLRSPVNDISNDTINMQIIDKTLELMDLSSIPQNIKKK